MSNEQTKKPKVLVCFEGSLYLKLPSCLEHSAAGILDEEIAQELTDLGYRSPMGLIVLPSTVRSIRLKHGIFHKRSRSHPSCIEGAVTIAQW